MINNCEIASVSRTAFFSIASANPRGSRRVTVKRWASDQGGSGWRTHLSRAFFTLSFQIVGHLHAGTLAGVHRYDWKRIGPVRGGHFEYTIKINVDIQAAAWTVNFGCERG